MSKIFGIVAILFVLGLSAAEAGDITGTVVLQSSSVPDRAKNSNPNRKQTLKKYGMKASGRAKGGNGGLPKNEKVDERDYAVIYLTNEKDGAKLKATPKTVEIRQKKRRFFNHVTPLALGSSVLFTNEDKYYHHIYCPESTKLSVPEHRGGAKRKPPSLGKFELFCDIHPLMNAYAYVVPNDKFTRAKGGLFTLKNVPSGNYILKVWHPRLPGSSQAVTVGTSSASKVNVTL